jgi:hypothetical protein
MVRVLRLIEYVYEDAETAEKDMANWNAPAIGSVPRVGPNKRIRSTILTDLDWGEALDNRVSTC